jgi:Transposase domain (DUF772)
VVPSAGGLVLRRQETPEPEPPEQDALTALSPAEVWVGVKNSDAVGLRLDLKAEMYLNATKVGEGQLINVASGSSGFTNARLHAIPLTLLVEKRSNDWGQLATGQGVDYSSHIAPQGQPLPVDPKGSPPRATRPRADTSGYTPGRPTSGSLSAGYIHLCDRLGAIHDDQLLAPLFPARGRPAASPWRVALITVIQFADGLSDRQAANASRGRIEWMTNLVAGQTAHQFDVVGPGFGSYRHQRRAGRSDDLSALALEWEA